MFLIAIPAFAFSIGTNRCKVGARRTPAPWYRA